MSGGPASGKSGVQSDGAVLEAVTAAEIERGSVHLCICIP